jgi:hypothetical protein
MRDTGSIHGQYSGSATELNLIIVLQPLRANAITLQEHVEVGANFSLCEHPNRRMRRA